MKVYGKGGVCHIGDLHFSDIFTGSHKNYLKNCMTVLRKIVDKVKELKPACLVFEGDLVGMNDRLIKRREVLCIFCNFLKEINEICPVYALRGNHDSGDFPEFSFLEGLGLIKTTNNTDGVIDYYPNESFEVPEVRFHLVDFGHEREPIELYGGETSNVVVAHNNFTISGKTTWYSAGDGIELNSLTNWAGVDMVLSGHIHNPSPMEITTTMIDGTVCALFYNGCPTRPTKDLAKYDSVHLTQFIYNETEGYTDWIAHPFELEPAEEVFIEEALLPSEKTPAEMYIEDMSEEQLVEALDAERKENLKNLINEVVKSNVTTSDPLEQIEKFPNITDNVRNLCKTYYQNAVLASNAKAH